MFKDRNFRGRKTLPKAHSDLDRPTIEGAQVEIRAMYSLLIDLAGDIGVPVNEVNAEISKRISNTATDSRGYLNDQYLLSVTDLPTCEWCTRPTQDKGWCCDDAAHYSQPITLRS